MSHIELSIVIVGDRKRHWLPWRRGQERQVVYHSFVNAMDTQNVVFPSPLVVGGSEFYGYFYGPRLWDDADLEETP